MRHCLRQRQNGVECRKIAPPLANLRLRIPQSWQAFARINGVSARIGPESCCAAKGVLVMDQTPCLTGRNGFRPGCHMHLDMPESGGPCLGAALPRQNGKVGLAGHCGGGQPTAFGHGINPCVSFDCRNNDRAMRQVFVTGIGNNLQIERRFRRTGRNGDGDSPQ